ncbi:MAG: hypothetical protein QW587_04510 [Candidatus Bathyarchaeia archaeon]
MKGSNLDQAFLSINGKWGPRLPKAVAAGKVFLLNCKEKYVKQSE